MAGSVQRQKVYVQVTESRSCACWRRQGLTLMWETAYPTSNAAMALTPGSTHRDPVAYSRTASRRIMGCSSAEPSLTVRPDGESGRAVPTGTGRAGGGDVYGSGQRPARWRQLLRGTVVTGRGLDYAGTRCLRSLTSAGRRLAVASYGRTRSAGVPRRCDPATKLAWTALSLTCVPPSTSVSKKSYEASTG